jgi:hypothetical protein
VSPSAFSASIAEPTIPAVVAPAPVAVNDAPEPPVKSKPSTKQAKPAAKKTEKPAPPKKTRAPAKPAAKVSPTGSDDPEYDPDSLFIKKKP